MTPHRSSVHRSPANEAARKTHQTATALSGWASFAAVLFLLSGVFNLIAGGVAAADDPNFAGNELFVGELDAWAVILVGFGALQVFTSWLIFRRSAMGQVAGILIAGFNLVAHLFFVGVYPIWSVIIMAINALVIYALTVYGDDFG